MKREKNGTEIDRKIGEERIDKWTVRKILIFPSVPSLLGRVKDFCPFSSARDSSQQSRQREKRFFPFFFFPPLFLFFFFFFLPRQKKTRRITRVNTSAVVQQEAFNQRAWKILFTRSRTPHRSPLYVPILLLYTCTRGSITHQTNVSRSTPRFRATRLYFSLPLSGLKSGIVALFIDSSRIDFSGFRSIRQKGLFDCLLIGKLRFETRSIRGFSNGAKKKVSFFLSQIKFDKTFELCRNFRKAKESAIKSALLIVSIVTN